MASSERVYEVGAVANFMIGRAKKARRPLTHLKLQHLVYAAYGVCLADQDRRLFKQRIEAWGSGPVVPALYHEFKRFGTVPIRDWSTDFNYETRHGTLPIVEDHDRLALHALNVTWSLYGKRSVEDLTKHNRRIGSPWNKAYAMKRQEIPDEWIKEEFSEVLAEVVARVLDQFDELLVE